MRGIYPARGMVSESVQTETPDDLRTALGAAFDAAQNAPDAKEPERAPVEAPAEDRPRDERGRFAPRASEEEGEAAPKAEGEKPAVEAEAIAAEPEEKPGEPTAKVEAPQNWSPADRAMFAKVPQEAQEFLVRRHAAMEADYTKKTQEIAAFRRDYEPIAQLFAPHGDALRQRGMTPAAAVKAWYDVEQGLMSGGAGAVNLLAAIAENYRLDKNALVARLGGAAPGAPPPQPEGTPEAAAQDIPPAVKREIERLSQWQAQQEYQSRQAMAAQQMHAAQTMENEITQFAQAADTSGALLHPHFQEVYNDMVALVMATRASGKNPVLSEIYDQAVRANPSTYAKVLETERAAWEAQRADVERQKQAEARAKAESARKAAVSVTGAPSPGQPPRRGEKSLRDELMAAAEESEAA